MCQMSGRYFRPTSFAVSLIVMALIFSPVVRAYSVYGLILLVLYLVAAAHVARDNQRLAHTFQTQRPRLAQAARSARPAQSTTSREAVIKQNLQQEKPPEKVFDEDPQCVVCLEDMSSEAVLGKQCTSYLPCGHRFHTDCITPWLLDHPSCPTCRTPIDRQARLLRAAFV